MARFKNGIKKEDLLNKEFDIMLTGAEILYIAAILGKTNHFDVKDKVERYEPNTSADILNYKENLVNIITESSFVQDRYEDFYILLESM